jgi:DNA-binding MarR family transcriptional regulator
MRSRGRQPLLVWRSMLRATAHVGRLVRHALRAHGLSGAQFGVLRVVGEAGPEGITLSEVGEKLFVTCGNITGLVDRLEESGYVVREPHPTDRRALLAKLTPQGRAVFEELAPAHGDRIQRIMSCLSAEEQAALIDLLSRLEQRAASLDEHADAPPAAAGE